MAFVRAAVKLILRERATYDFQPPVLCLGVPEIYATFAELSGWCREIGRRPCALSASQAEVTNHPAGSRLGWVNASTFFKALGLEPVVTVDIAGAEHVPSMVHDLNEPFPDSMHGRFKLVLDPGTTEHVFDVKTCLTNIARALAIGGTAVHQVPIYMYNGGYYSMNPIVLHDFYRANGFADIGSFVLMWDRYHPYTGPTRVYAYDDALLGARHALADRDQVRYAPLLLTFARKVEDRAVIVSPLQYEGHYFTPETDQVRPTNWLKHVRDRAFTAIDRSRWHSLRALKTRVGREVRLFRIHRRSFWL